MIEDTLLGFNKEPVYGSLRVTTREQTAGLVYQFGYERICVNRLYEHLHTQFGIHESRLHSGQTCTWYLARVCVRVFMHKMAN